MTPLCKALHKYNVLFVTLFSLSSSDVEAFAKAMQGSKGDGKKEDDEDMSLD